VTLDGAKCEADPDEDARADHELEGDAGSQEGR
jgi:hypothetical protein